LNASGSDPGKPVDVSNCEKEPIHIPGSIQAHGVLLSLREPQLEVMQVSANAAALFGIGPELLVGRLLEELLDAAAVAELTQALESNQPHETNCFRVKVGADDFDALVHRHDGATILELERVDSGQSMLPLHRRLQRAVSRLQHTHRLRELCDTTVKEIRELTGFDRVLVYRFDDEDNGEVLAEDKAEGLEPFLGLHYPASDIPRQARQLYLLNWVRLIADRDARPSRLVPALRPDDGRPLDLSFASLRSVSPVHIEYLRNLGVKASMSISLIRGGRLWGLVSCGHHQAARHVPYDVRVACEVIGRLMSQQIGEVEELEQSALRRKVAGVEELLAGAMRAEQVETLSALRENPNALLELVQANGVAVWSEEICFSAGLVPPREKIEALVGWLRSIRVHEVFKTRALQRQLPPSLLDDDTACGLLAVSIPRPVNWGGDPTKPLDEGGGTQLRPRRSFELWKEVVRGTSLPWTRTELEVAKNLRRYAIEVDLTRQVVREQRAVQAREELVAVVSHDLKNPLGAIQMNAALILRAASPPDAEQWQRVQSSAARIQRSTDRMTGLVKDLLDLAKIESGRFRIEPRVEEVQSLLEQSFEVLKPLAEQKNISLTPVFRAPPDVAVEADPERVFQVLSNLIGNAIKFTPKGGNIRVTVETGPAHVKFAVSDSGPGIPAEQLPHLFDRYWQARHRAREGAGLGLYIVRGLVEAHGGRVWAESQGDSGSTFFFTLPAAREADRAGA
jgi:chemotaxis family two-component system sensor kinase Cph1